MWLSCGNIEPVMVHLGNQGYRLHLITSLGRWPGGGGHALLLHKRDGATSGKGIGIDNWANILWLTDTFAYLFGFPGEYYKVTIRDWSIAFRRILTIYNWKFSINIKYRRYSPTFAWLTDITDMSVSHAKVGLYLQYFILFENFQL